MTASLTVSFLIGVDISATIVFITTHGEMTPVVFRLKVEAMDYVVKDSPTEEIERRIKECMGLSYERYLKGKHTGEKLFQIITKDNVVKIPFDDILFFEVEPDHSIRHQVILYTATKKFKFRSTIKQLAKEHEEFFICHQSIAVNLNNIKEVDKKNMEVTMVNDDIIPVSHRKLAGLLKAWKH
jgi:two-component system response regulator AgrA